MAKKKKNVVRIWKPMAGGFFSIISGSVAIGWGSETMVGIVAAQYPGFLDSGLLQPVLIGYWCGGYSRWRLCAAEESLGYGAGWVPSWLFPV
jgi:hypothetical protein